MHTNKTAGRTLTELDHARLNKPEYDPLPDALDEALSLAELVDSRAVAPNVITMYSQVDVRMIDGGQRRKLTLCYPEDAEPAAGFISVLSPVGTALLGLREGDTARWVTPNGDACQAEVMALLFQPEASGDFTT